MKLVKKTFQNITFLREKYLEKLKIKAEMAKNILHILVRKSCLRDMQFQKLVI